MKREIHIFFTALMFFTRIPCPKWVNHDPAYLEKSTRYFPLVGMIVGGIGASVFWIFSQAFSIELALILSIAATIYTTGAFHEDGFADVCDGLGGGWTKEKILLIMKDSRLGTYGTLGIVLLLATKLLALKEIDAAYIPIILVAGHSSSRFIAVTLIYTHPYVQDAEKSKAKPAAEKMKGFELLMAGIFGVLPILVFLPLIFLLSLLPMYVSKLFLGYKFKKWLGGQTGDCAGAVQQLSEVVFYLTALGIWQCI